MSTRLMGAGNYVASTRTTTDDRQLSGELSVDADGKLEAPELDLNAHGCGGVTTMMFSPVYQKLSGTVTEDQSLTLTIKTYERDMRGQEADVELRSTSVDLQYDESSETYVGTDLRGVTHYLKLVHCKD